MKINKNKPESGIQALQDDFKEDLSDVLSEFEKRAKEEKVRDTEATGSRFYLCLCFQSQEQMLEFSEKSGFNKISDDIFIDGMKAAKLMGIKLESEVPPIRKINNRNDYAKYSMKKGE